MALSKPERYILKPQREGGGNNVYRSAIRPFLLSLPDETYYDAYILMDMINPPPSKAVFIRDGGTVAVDGITEFSVYGTILWDSDTGAVFANDPAGWFVRTKPVDENEGHWMTGRACMNSICLV